jgi:dolichol-phosphate mannosyltransferase
LKTLRNTAVRGLKFYSVGALGIAVQLIALTLLTDGAGLDYLLATVIAVEVAVLHNFYWHERFTWSDRPCALRHQTMARLMRFNLTTGAMSILGNIVFMRLLVGHFQLHPLPANVVSIGICSLLNFFVSDQMVFRRLQPSGE